MLHIFHHPRVLIGGGHPFYIVLQLLGETLGGLVSLFQDDGSLHHLAPHGVRRAGDGALMDCRVGEKHRFNLEGADAVGGTLDNVIVAADEPIIAILVHPHHVSGVVDVVFVFCRNQPVPHPVAPEQALRVVFIQTAHHQFSLIAGSNGTAVLPHQGDVVEGAGLSHGAGPGLEPAEVCHQHAPLRLAIALVDGEAGDFRKLPCKLRGEGLPSGAAVGNGGKVLRRQPFPHHKAVDGAGDTKGGGPLFPNHFNHPLGIKLMIHLVPQNGRAADPLSIDAPPSEFGPAGIHPGEMKAAVLHLLPVAGGDDVPQGIGVVVAHHFGHPRGAGGKVNEHQILGGEGSVCHKAGGTPLQGGRIIQPAGTALRTVHQRLAGEAFAAFFQGRLALGNNPVILEGDEKPHPCGVHPVGDVLGGKLVGGRDNHRPDAVEGHGGDPVLPPALQEAHHPVPLLHPPGQQPLGGPPGKGGDLPEGKGQAVAVVVAPLQGPLIRLRLRPGIHHMGGKVEIRRATEPVVFLKILIGIKLGPGKESLQHIHHSPLLSFVQDSA